MKKDKGLTLIELAIVLIVLGILLGIGAGIIGVLIKRVKYNESKEIVNAAVEGIIGYATSSRRLPNSSELNSAVRSTKDAYGKDIAYVYDSNLASTPAPIYGFCGLTSTNITVKVCSDTACTTPIQTINNVAFVIISGDGNYNNQTAGTQGVNSATEIKVYEYGVQVDDFQQPGDDDPDRVEPYDDIVKWVSLNELQRAQGCESLTIASPTTLPAAIEDNAYTYTLTANGGRPPYTWSGTIGNGLTLSSDGTISGTVNTNTATSTGEVPSCSTSISFTATVTDSAGQSVSQNFTIPVQARPVEIITNTLPDAYEGSPYSADIDAIGGDGSYTFSGNSLPSWLTLNTSTGVLSGTPPTDSDCSEGVSNFSVTASSCSNTYTKGYSITVRDPDCTSGSGGGSGCSTPLSLTPPSGSSYNASVGVSFGPLNITVSGGQSPYTNTTCTPSSCNGLSLNCTSTGASISGTPTTTGTCTFQVGWQDSCSPPNSVTGQYTVNIQSACDPFTGWTSSLPDAELCKSYTGSITVLGGEPPYTWSIVSGSLPAGLNFCSTTSNMCSITGTSYDSVGSYTFDVQVADSCSTGIQTTTNTFSINLVYPPGSEGNAMQSCINDRGGLILREQGGRVSYRVSGDSNCYSISQNGEITIQPGKIYTFYSGNNCGGNPICSANFCDVWNEEWSNGSPGTGNSYCRVDLQGGNGTTCTLNDS